MGVHLAEDFGGEIVSLDSRQLYRRLDIGTAKPTPAERRRARHHLVDVAEPTQRLDLAEVQKAAYAAIDEILARGWLPILVGGTGQYVRAVLEGWQVPRVAPDHALRSRLQQEAAAGGAEALHARLAVVDPTAAARIDARNVRRVIRALEVYEHAGKPISALRARQRPPYDALVLGLTRPREMLYRRIDERIDNMIAAGLEEEVRSLVAQGVGFDRAAMSGVGYREWRAHLDGEIDRPEVVRRIRRNTRRLVRQQAGWFRADDPSIRWFDLEATDYDAVRATVAAHLAIPRSATDD
jgi:tRNA dimethylallyltransferase